MDAFRFTEGPPSWQGMDDTYPEGNVGGQFGDLVVSTPNAQVIYAPLCDAPCSLVLCEGNHFGVYDPMKHPQLYDSANIHLACMPTPSALGEHGILFIRLDKSQHWEHGATFDGLGQIKASVVARLASHGEHILDELERVVQRGRAGELPYVPKDMLPNAKTKRTSWHLKQYLRMVGRPGSFEDCALRWANTQRLQLDLRGVMDYLTIYRPLFNDLPAVPRPVDNNRAGCITTNFLTACEIYAVGLPVWYVYKAKGSLRSNFRRFLAPSDIDKLLTALSITPRPIQMGQSDDRAFISLRRPPNYVSLWTGRADDAQRFLVMAEVLRGGILPTVAPLKAPSSTLPTAARAAATFAAQAASTSKTPTNAPPMGPPALPVTSAASSSSAVDTPGSISRSESSKRYCCGVVGNNSCSSRHSEAGTQRLSLRRPGDQYSQKVKVVKVYQSLYSSSTSTFHYSLFDSNLFDNKLGRGLLWQPFALG